MVPAPPSAPLAPLLPPRLLLLPATTLFLLSPRPLLPRLPALVFQRTRPTSTALTRTLRASSSLTPLVLVLLPAPVPSVPLLEPVPPGLVPASPAGPTTLLAPVLPSRLAPPLWFRLVSSAFLVVSLLSPLLCKADEVNFEGNFLHHYCTKEGMAWAYEVHT